ncbi:MAG: inorganic diphosphatase [Patescibacteria group bacterium]|jgi:inorganic pyrophosphatase
MMEIKVFIEVSAGGRVKYEFDERTRELKVDRFLHSAIVFPFNYGSIEGIMGKDGDPLDALVLSEQPVEPGVVIRCRPIGLLEMKDEAGIDTKIITVPLEEIDPVFGQYDNIDDVPEASLKEIRHFFRNYKSLEPGKWVKVHSFRKRADAEKLIKSAMKK